MSLGCQLHVGSIAVVRKGQNPLDTLGFEFINIFLDSWNGISKGHGGSCIGDIACCLWVHFWFDPKTLSDLLTQVCMTHPLQEIGSLR